MHEKQMIKSESNKTLNDTAIGPRVQAHFLSTKGKIGLLRKMIHQDKKHTEWLDKKFIKDTEIDATERPKLEPQQNLSNATNLSCKQSLRQHS